MLNADLKAQVRAHLSHLVHPIELAASLDDSVGSEAMLALLEEITALAPTAIVLVGEDRSGRRPSFMIRRQGGSHGVIFAGLPLGHQLSSLVLALLHISGHPPRLDPDLIARAMDLQGDHSLETWFARDCLSCPETVQAINLISVVNPRVRHVAVDGSLFRNEAQARDLRAVPVVLQGGVRLGQGRMGVEPILALLTARQQRPRP